MPSTYYAIFTAMGLTRLAEAQVSGTPIAFVDVAVGDGGPGGINTPDPSLTALRNERWRGTATTELDPSIANTVRVEGHILAATGGFTIREVGLFNGSGEMIAYASYPTIYKPTPGEGASVDEYIRVLLTYAAVDAISLTVDGSVIVASRAYVDGKVEMRNISFAGRNGIGACTEATLTAGDIVLSLLDVSTPPFAHAEGSFEEVITVDEQIRQTSVSNLSGHYFLGLIRKGG